MIDIITDNNSVFVTVNGKILRYTFCDDNGILIIRFLPPQKPICFSSDFSDILSFLTKDLSEKITLQNICSEFYTNKRAIEKLFRENTGMTYHEYMTELRLGTAIAFLFSPKNSVADIAQATGFSSSQNFSKFFSKNLKLSPSEFRASLQEKVFEILNENRLAITDNSGTTDSIYMYIQSSESGKKPLISSISVTPPRKFGS